MSSVLPKNGLGLTNLASSDTTNISQLGPGTLLSIDPNIDGKTVDEACDYLLRRDWSIIAKLNHKYKPGTIGLIMLPSTFHSAVPDILDPERFEHIARTKKMSQNQIIGKRANFSGDRCEKVMYESLKTFYKNQDVVVIHSPKFRTLNGNHSNEKDFIIINLQKGYVLSIEVKRSINGVETIT